MTNTDYEKISAHPDCSVFCRACHHKHLTYQESLQQKFSFLQKTLYHFADLISDIICAPPEQRIGYRTKVTLSATYSAQKIWEFGVISKDTVIPIPRCPIHSKQILSTLVIFSHILPDSIDFPLKYYVQNGSQVGLILKTAEIPSTSWLDDKTIWLLVQNQIDGVWLHLNPSVGKKVFAKKTWKLIWGKHYSQDNNSIFYGIRTFAQPVPELLNQAHLYVLKYFSPSRNDIFIDLFCGTGILLQKASAFTHQILGVELTPESITIGRLNLPDTPLLHGTCEQRIPQIDEWVKANFQTSSNLFIHLNPPRTGAGKTICEWISSKLKPEKIAYMSCSAGTLSKDLEYITSHGYCVDKIIPFDFFPHTMHIETLVLLQKTS